MTGKTRKTPAKGIELIGRPTHSIAEKFIQYYWRQSGPYLVLGERQDVVVLQQNTGKQAGIIRVLEEVRRTSDGSLAIARRRQQWTALVARVDEFVRTMPLWKLQTVGSERLDFLYDNRDEGRTVTLKPGVSFCFRRHYGLVADLVRGAWARYVRRFNARSLGTSSDLHEFLFGSERSDLSAVVPVLKEVQVGECFYCRRPLIGEAAHVDHFIPWSRYSLDLGHNLVLAHGACNGKKSDRIASEEHLTAWAEHTERNGATLRQEFDALGIVSDFTATARIVNWAYHQTFLNGGLAWVRGDEMRPLSAEWSRPLIHLLN